MKARPHPWTRFAVLFTLAFFAATAQYAWAGPTTTALETTASDAPPGLSTASPAAKTAIGDETFAVVRTQRQLGGLGAALGFGFLAGLILNVMPCVLPVISLKIHGFVRQAGEERQRVRLLGLAFGAGIVFVFLILAGLAAFAGLGWGQQFQSDTFLIAMIALLVVFALGMFEVYTFRLPGFVSNVEAATAQREGIAGSFAKGMLATLLATPCSGPFLGATLAYALTQPPAVIFAVFAAIGLGMASPYVLLAWHPSWLKIVPRGGEWMNTFKELMGFLMLGTAAWLLWQRRSNGELVVWTVVFCLFVALGTWLYGRWSTPLSSSLKRFAAPLAAAALVAFGGEFSFGWMYSPPAPVSRNSTSAAVESSAPWQPFGLDKFLALRREGKTIVVDWTADW